MKALGIARVSDIGQEDGQSTPAQVRRVTEHATDRDLDLLEVYEITESSTKDTRKKFETVIKRIKESKEPIALIVDTIDRLQRSFRESVELGDLLKQGKLELHFLRENLVLNKDSNSADMYDKKLKEYKGKQAEVLQSMQDHSRADQNYHITASLVLDLAKRAFEIFDCSETLEKRALINFVFQNMKLKDGKLVWDLKEPFDIIVKYADHPIWLPRLDSNQ